MTLHFDELPRLGVVKTAVAGKPRPVAADRWHHPQRSEVALPSPGSMASVLVMGLFALSLAGAGIGYQLTRWRRG